MNRPWSNWMYRLFQTANRKKVTRASRPAPRLGIEHLEDRVVPATTITILPGAAGTGSLDAFLSATDGTINATDSLGVAGSVSQGALQAIGAGIQVSITAQTAIVFDATLTTPVALQTDATSSAQFIALNGNITFNDTTDTLTTAGAGLTLVATNGGETLGNLATTNGNINLITDAVAVVGTVNAGTGIVAIAPSSTATVITVGGGATGLGVSDTELGQITASVVRIGDKALNHTGTITIDGAVTRHAGYNTLALYTGNATATAVTQTAALSVAKLNVQTSGGNITLTTVANDVDFLAADSSTVAGTTATVLAYSESNNTGFVIDTVDGDTGVATDAVAGSRITLLSGGSVTQTAGADVTGQDLQLLGSGSYALNNVGNNVVTLAAATTGAVSYTDADALTIGTVNATPGIATSNANISVSTVNGSLTVQNTAAAVDVNAGNGAVALTAGSTGAAGNLLDIQAAATMTGNAGVTLTADNIIIAGTLTAGASTATLRPFQPATLINLGGADGANTLGLTDAELDNVTAGRIVVGQLTAAGPPATFVNTGNVTISAALTPANAPALSVFTGGQIISGGGTITLTGAANLTLAAGTGVGTAVAPVVAVVSTLEGRSNTGGFFLNSGTITIGTGDAAFTGLSVGGGDIVIQSTTNITASEAVSSTGGGDITLRGITITVNAPVSATGGNGLILISGTGDVLVNAAVSAAGSGSITLVADADINAAGDFTSTAPGTLTTATGNISVTGANAVTLAGPISTTGASVSATVTQANGTLSVNGTISAPSTTSPNGVVSFTADNMAIAASVTAGRQVNIVSPFAGTRAIDLGTETAGKLSLTDTELDFLLTPVINIGNATPTTTITVTAPITLANVVTTVFLNAGSDVTESGAGSFVMANTNSLLQFFVTGGLVNFSNVANDVARVSGTLFNATSPFTYVDANTVAVTGISTANGAVSVTSVAGAVNVTGNVTTGTGTAAISIDAGTGFSLAASTTIQSGDNTAGGPITIRANVGAAAGTADIVLSAGSTVLTRGNIVLNADPDGNGTGGGITIPATASLAGPAGTLANSITLVAGKDVTASTLSSATFITITTSANIFDDGVDTTSLNAGTNITLTSGGRVGGTTPITTADVESASTASPTATFLGALDVAYTGTLTLQQTGAQGNVQIRKVGTGLATSTVVINNPTNFVGNGNQFALISAAGNLTVDNAFTISGGNNANVLLATTGPAVNNVVFAAGSSFTNNGNATTTIAATGTPTAAITGPAADNNPEIQVQNLVLFTTGGAIGAVGTPLEFNAVLLNGKTTGKVNNVAQAGGTATMTDTTTGLQVGQFDAGTGNVTLASRGDVGGNGVNLTAVTPNDGIAEIIGNVISLDTSAATANGATGQIGSFTTTAQFFEVNATVLNATTNNSRVWISDLAGGVAIGTVNVGTDTAILKSVGAGGAITSNVVDGTPDIVAGTLIISTPNGGNIGGAAGSPLEIDAATALVATVTGTGLINITDTAGGLPAATATTGTGNVTLNATGGALTVLNAAAAVSGNIALSTTTSGALTVQKATTAAGTFDANSAAALILGTGSSTAPSVVTATGAATLTAVGAITSGANAGVMDVVAATLGATAGTGVGTSGTPLETTVGTIAATSPTGGIFITNAAATTVGVVGAVTGVTATTSGDISITSTGGTSSLTVANPVTATAGNVTLTAGAALAVNAAVSGTNITATSTGALTTSAAITGTGTVALTSSDLVSLTAAVGAGAGGVTVAANGGNLTTTGGGTITSTGPVGLTSSGATSLGAIVSGTSITATAGTTLSTTAAVTGTGTVGLTASAGALTVGANVSAGGTVTLTSTDTAATTNNVVLNAGTTVSTTGTTININAGDDATLNGTLTTAAGGTVNVLVDQGAVDVGVGSTVTTSATTSVTGATSVVITSGADADTFNLRPLATAVITLAGAAPTAAPGDALNIDLTGATTPALAPTAVGAGGFTAANRAAVNFTGIEATNITGGTVALTLDMTAFNGGFQNASASPDVVNVSTTAGGVLNVTVQDNSTGTPVSFFSGLATGVSSFTLTGSTDRETVVIDETNPGVPTSTINAGNPTTAPGDSLVTNTTNVTGPTFTPGGTGAGTFMFTNRNNIAFTGIETVATAIVSIAATDATAAEKGVNETQDGAVFTLTRQGDLTNPLTVAVTLTGTAVNGIDYATAPTSVTFAAGAATATIVITVLNNSIVDGSRTVIATVLAGTGYTLSTASTATATIADNDVTAFKRVAVATGSGGQVAVFDNGSKTPTFAGTAFPGYTGPTAVAVGDVNGDGVPDIVIVGAPNGATTLVVVDGAKGTLLLNKGIGSFGNATVAVGDVDGDGRGEIVVGLTNFPAFGIFDGVSGNLRVGVLAYAGAPVGVAVAVGDINGDGKAEIVTTPTGLAPLVRVYDGNGVVLNQFLAFDPAIAGVGATVAVGDLNGDGKAEIVVGASALGSNFVLVFNGVTQLRTGALQLPATPATSKVGKFGPPVATADANGDGVDDIFVTVGTVTGAFNGQTLALISSSIPFPGATDGVVIG